jgi:hypothetical protein
LTHLDLYASFIGEAGIAALVASPHLTNLTSLNVALAGPPLGVAAVRTLAAWPRLARLTSLDLTLDAEGAAALASSPHVTGLTRLHLCGWAEDAGAAALASSPFLTNLAHLGLRRNGIGDAGALALAGSPSLVNLRSLRLEENRIGEQGMKALRDRFGERVTRGHGETRCERGSRIVRVYGRRIDCRPRRW